MMARKPKPSGRKLPDKGSLLARRAIKTRELRPRFLIVCGGEKTEPNYFRSFRVNAVVEVKGTGRSPMGVVEYAQKIRCEEYTQVWVVFDRDDFDAEEFNRSIRQAGETGFRVAYSNEAFELWYVLHFGYQNTALSRRDYQKILTEKLGKTYKKNDIHLYADLLARQNEAIANAQRLFEVHQPYHNPAADNPCTTVHLLVMELNKYLQ
ncbi:MAG: RloB family protein [Chloroflexota bacterium]